MLIDKQINTSTKYPTGKYNIIGKNIWLEKNEMGEFMWRAKNHKQAHLTHL